MARNGWIKLYRQMTDWEWYTDGNTMRVFLHILLKANGGEDDLYVKGGYKVRRGQYASTIKSISEDLHMSYDQTRNAIKHLQDTNNIQITKHAKLSVFSVVNYNAFQRTSQQDTNIIPTSYQQTSKSLLSKKMKEERKGGTKESSDSSSAPVAELSPEEFRRLRKEGKLDGFI